MNILDYSERILKVADPSLQLDSLMPDDIIQEAQTIALDAVQEWASLQQPFVMDADMAEQLSDRQRAQYVAQRKIADENGLWAKEMSSEGAHYTEQNPFKAQGIICKNCAHYEPGKCEIVEGAIAPDAICKLWIIPNSKIKLQSRTDAKVVKWKGLTIGITHEPGEMRFPMGVPMAARYGRIHRSWGKAEDGKAIDVYMNPEFDPSSDAPIYRIIQIDPATGMKEESKYGIGFKSPAEFRQAHEYHAGRDRFGMIEEVDGSELDAYRQDAEYHADNCGCEACAAKEKKRKRRSKTKPVAEDEENVREDAKKRIKVVDPRVKGGFYYREQEVSEEEKPKGNGKKVAAVIGAGTLIAGGVAGAIALSSSSQQKTKQPDQPDPTYIPDEYDFDLSKATIYVVDVQVSEGDGNREARSLELEYYDREAKKIVKRNQAKGYAVIDGEKRGILKAKVETPEKDHANRQLRYIITYTLPPGVSVEGVPDDWAKKIYASTELKGNARNFYLATRFSDDDTVKPEIADITSKIQSQKIQVSSDQKRSDNLDAEDDEQDLADYLVERANPAFLAPINAWITASRNWLKQFSSVEAAQEALKKPQGLYSKLKGENFADTLADLLILSDLAGQDEVLNEDLREDSLSDSLIRLDAPRPKWLNLSFKEAIAFFRKKLNIPIGQYNDLSDAYHQYAFSISGVTRADMLQDIRTIVDQAVADGTSYESLYKQWNRSIGRKYGWRPGERRVYLILDTNSRQAIATGRGQQMTDPDVIKRRPLGLWRWRDSPNPRLNHQQLNNKAIPLSHPFWRKCPAGNCGFGCRCGVYSISEDYAKRKGIEILKNPPDPEAIAEPGFRRPLAGASEQDRAQIIEDAKSRLSPDLQVIVEDEEKRRSQ